MKKCNGCVIENGCEMDPANCAVKSDPVVVKAEVRLNGEPGKYNPIPFGGSFKVSSKAEIISYMSTLAKEAGFKAFEVWIDGYYETSFCADNEG